ncbi:MAG: 1-acyl-sn-glycerol-3-phosphate acyltransferase, partial [Xanthobacteraceae bacterium]|nr:1-acyl-sn-glycerol-3-phosphate acyltransferase [Xanthobacteraceae bacterium]
GVHGFPLGRQHRPVVAWYGDFALGPHLIGVLRRGAIDVVLTWGEPVVFEEVSDRKAVARALEADVRRHTALALRGRAGGIGE